MSGAPVENPAGSGVPELSVVIPTYNEADNIDELIGHLETALEGIRWNVIFVDDDSPDGTAARILAHAAGDDRVRLIRRLGRQGLASACIEGMLSTNAPCVAVMDADLQHDETRLGEMLRVLRRGDADLVVASRYMEGGDAGGLSGPRPGISRAATVLGKKLLGVSLTDPMSGFFMVRRALVEEIHRDLYPHGFKILLDLGATLGDRARIAEIPYRMRSRHAGESKLGPGPVLHYFGLLGSKLTHRFLPARFLLFALVGLSGVTVHMGVLWVAHRLLGQDFRVSLVAAFVVAMTTNYLLNNRYTFRDARLSGRAFFRGLGSFYAVCTVGALIGYASGNFLFREGFPWWASGLVATVASAFWNFSVSSLFTWRVSG